MIEQSKKMKHYKQSIFGQLKEAAKQSEQKGLKIIDLSLGSPDLPPAKIVREKLSEASLLAGQYGYTLGGTENFNKAVSRYYKRRVNVSLKQDKEVLLTMGSQEGLVHLPTAFCNPGDVVLTTDPAYVAYDQGIHLAGANPYYMPLTKENDFLPDLTAIPNAILKKAKLLILNLPGNPVPAMPTYEFFEEVVQFAKKHQILVLHDAAYSEYYFQGDKPMSFLEIEGAKDVGLEMNSLSKSFSLAGARVAYVVGNEKAIAIFKQLKSNLDYGVFQPIQEASIVALDHAEEITNTLRATFKKRHQIIMQGLTDIGWEVAPSQGGMFVWTKYPYKMTSEAFAFKLIDEIGLVTVPGTEFGENGSGYLRVALVQNEEQLKEAIFRLQKFTDIYQEEE